MTQLSERQQLILECKQLVDQIAHRPGYLKLLAGARQALEIYASYKINRHR